MNAFAHPRYRAVAVLSGRGFGQARVGDALRQPDVEAEPGRAWQRDLAALHHGTCGQHEAWFVRWLRLAHAKPGRQRASGTARGRMRAGDESKDIGERLICSHYVPTLIRWQLPKAQGKGAGSNMLPAPLMRSPKGVALFVDHRPREFAHIRRIIHHLVMEQHIWSAIRFLLIAIIFMI